MLHFTHFAGPQTKQLSCKAQLSYGVETFRIVFINFLSYLSVFHFHGQFYILAMQVKIVTHGKTYQNTTVSHEHVKKNAVGALLFSRKMLEKEAEEDDEKKLRWKVVINKK